MGHLVDAEQPVLVIGATGFLGGRVVAALHEAGRRVRCLVRDPARATALAAAGADLVAGDMLDAGAVGRAVEGVAAVVVSVHTVSRQPQGSGRDFTDVEDAGLRTVVAACRAHGVRRVLYVTAVGVSADSANAWQRGRAATEAMLFASGLDATVVRPPMIVGRGGHGFGVVLGSARRRVAVLLSSPRQRFRTIAVDDLAGEIVALLDEPRSYGHHYDVGSDDVLTVEAMIDEAAGLLGRRPPRKLHLPRRLLRPAAPVLERVARLPSGALSGLLGEGSDLDVVGDPAPIRQLLGDQPRPFRTVLADVLADDAAATRSA